MTLFRIKSAPFVLIEDDLTKNILPLLIELIKDEKDHVNLFCYEQPSTLWRNVLKHHSNINYHDEFNSDLSKKSAKCSVIIDSVNQMALNMGWHESLKCLKRLQSDPNVNRLILVLHRDCMLHTAKLQSHLHHMVNAIISYDNTNPQKVWVKLKKGSKVLKSEELITYDNMSSSLRFTPVIKEQKKEEETPKLLPGNLTTFKIEVDQSEKIHKDNLKLPYMSKIHEGESKVYYEPDAVDDWDEEDPDEDLDI